LIELPGYSLPVFLAENPIEVPEERRDYFGVFW